MPLYNSDFKDRVLFEPARHGAEHLKIVSGYATHTMASWHIKEIAFQSIDPIEISLIVGMCLRDGISTSVHKGFQDIMNRNNTPRQSNLLCQYVYKGSPVHSKMYLWEKNGQPFCAFIGSANYTQSAFSNRRRELIHECDPLEAAAYYEKVESDSIYCNHDDVKDNIKIVSSLPRQRIEESPHSSIDTSGLESVTLSLLMSDGSGTGSRSGINWGQRDGREPNQAYIPLQSDISRTGFFPIVGDRYGINNPHFTALTDDGKQLILRVEQEGNKAITTPLNNSILGLYIRERIGVASGEFVTLEHLQDYGRTDISFYKIDDEQYFMDFSVVGERND